MATRNFFGGSSGKIQQLKLGMITASGAGNHIFNVAAVYPKYKKLTKDNFAVCLDLYVNVKRQERDYINVHMQINGIEYDNNTGILKVNIVTWNTGSQHAQPTYNIPIFIFTSGGVLTKLVSFIKSIFKKGGAF